MGYNKHLVNLLRLLIILVMPFFIGMGVIRAIILWDYPGFEYPRIAPDVYGFTPEERLDLAHGTLAYMQRLEPAEQVIYMLEDLRFPGTDTPLYEPDEISHMIDVKNVTDGMLFSVVFTGFIVVVGLAYLIGNRPTHVLGWKTLFQAGLFTVLFLAALGLFILIAWPIFFVQFHELLFPPGTWTFSYSASLIRLFPERFWFDIGVLISGTAFVLGLLVMVFGYVMWRRAAARA